MKILLILLGLVVLVFVAVQVFSRNSQKDIETYKYEVIKTYDGFEVRQYEAALFTSVELSSSGYREGSGKAFSVLGGYIFGANETEETIAMTAPVSMTMDDNMTMMFLVPSEYTIDDLPTPKDGNIEFKQVPARKMAAITFGGWADDDKIEHYRQELVRLLDDAGISLSGQYHFYGYNAPYEVFNRKNEVVIELDK